MRTLKEQMANRVCSEAEEPFLRADIGFRRRDLISFQAQLVGADDLEHKAAILKIIKAHSSKLEKLEKRYSRYFGDLEER